MRKILLGLSLFLYSSLVLPVELIVNTKSGIKDTISLDEARDIFSFRKRYWDNNIPIKIFLLPRDSKTTEKFMHDVLRVPTDIYFEFYKSVCPLRLIEHPIIVRSETEMLIKILITQGGIGYSSLSFLQEIDESIDLKVIKVLE